MKTRKLGAFSLQFTHNQILAYDSSVSNPECHWSKQHLHQGFARRQSNVCFASLFDAADATVTVYLGQYVSDQRYLRVVAVPFYTPTGRVIVSGVLEIYLARVVFVPPGNYMLYCGQWFIDDETEPDQQLIDLFFHKLNAAASQSKILVADERIQQAGVLLEEANQPT